MSAAETRLALSTHHRRRRCGYDENVTSRIHLTTTTINTMDTNKEKKGKGNKPTCSAHTEETEGISYTYTAFDDKLQQRVANLYVEVEVLTAQLSRLSKRSFRRIAFNFARVAVYNLFVILVAGAAFVKVRIPPAYAGATLIPRPVLLGAIYRATSAPQGAAGSASDVFNPTKKAITTRSFLRTLARLGVDHRPPPTHPLKTTKALRLLYYVSGGNERWGLTRELYRKYWVEGEDVSNSAVLVESVRKVLVGERAEEVVRAIESGVVEGARERKMLEEATASAIERGAFGVPAFWVGEEVWTDREGRGQKGRLYWGQDRMHFVEAVARLIREGKNGQSLGQLKSVSLQSLVPRVVKQSDIPRDEEVKLEFWYDFSSPWAFLGWTQLARLQRQFGERLHIEMKPFLLGILFREIGAPNLPSLAVSEAKRAYLQLDHSDWTRWWNAVNEQEGKPDKTIEFYWADIFPIRTPMVLRAVLANPDLCALLYRACWEQNLDVGSEKVLAQVLDKAGYDDRAILDQANSPGVKSDLRARTQEAKDVGLCGVPSYRVFRRQVGEENWKQVSDIIWGQDEQAVVEDFIAGWDGTRTEGSETQQAKL
ncbi:hypothetical protein DV736_g4584, partial [Chaetothyriales sp. CBS 134916]